jgi:cell division protein FtsB
MKQISLKFVWGVYLKLRAEGDKLRAEGDKLWAEGDKLWAEGNKIRAEGDKLRAEGRKLRAEGDKLWAEGVIEAYGNVTIEWTSYNHCIVNGTDEFKAEE